MSKLKSLLEVTPDDLHACFKAKMYIGNDKRFLAKMYFDSVMAGMKATSTLVSPLLLGNPLLPGSPRCLQGSQTCVW